MTALVGTARQLAARKSAWSGTLVLIGQPAEEVAGGARAMLADGLYTRFPKPDYALGFHVWATAAAGTIMVPQTIAMSSVDSVDVVVHGVGTHGAYPHRGVDPILVASQIVVSLQSLVSRSIDPLEAGVVTVGAIHGGTRHNIIGDRVDLKLTVRSDNYETRATLLEGIERIAHGVARAHGVPDDKLPEVIVSKTETTPPTLNDEPTAAKIQSAFREHFGAARVPPNRREGMGGEDFAYYGAPEHGVKSRVLLRRRHAGGRARERCRPSFAAVQDRARALGHDRHRGDGRRRDDADAGGALEPQESFSARPAQCRTRLGRSVYDPRITNEALMSRALFAVLAAAVTVPTLRRPCRARPTASRICRASGRCTTARPTASSTTTRNTSCPRARASSTAARSRICRPRASSSGRTSRTAPRPTR